MKYTNLDWKNQQPFSKNYDDIYYSSEGARGEFEHVFFKGNNLQQRWKKRLESEKADFTIAELGFGSGTNFVLTVNAWLVTLQQTGNRHDQPKMTACLHYIAIEKNPLSPLDLQRVASEFPELSAIFNELLQVYPLPIEGVHRRYLCQGKVLIDFIFMDAEKALNAEIYKVDAWYMDGFSPTKNPELWSESLCLKMVENSACCATVATYSAAGVVKRHLSLAGFSVQKVKGHANKREMIIADLHRKPVSKSAHQPECIPFTDKPWFQYQNKKQISLADSAKKVAVLGNGIAGLTVAWSLYKQGWQVTLIDRNFEPASGASGNPAGIVTPRLSVANDIDMQFYGTAFNFAIQQLDEWQQRSTKALWHRCGAYQLMLKQRVEKVFQSTCLSENYAHKVEGDEVPTYFDLNDDEALLFYENAGVVAASSLCSVIQNTLLQATMNNETAFVQAEIASMVCSESGWDLLDKSGDCVHRSGIVVVANGAGADSLNISNSFALQSVRGQVSEIRSTPGSEVLKHVVNAKSYITPALNGVHHIGASYHPDDVSTAIRKHEHRENLTGISQTLPGLFDTDYLHNQTAIGEVSGRVAFRMVSKDRVPVIGAVPDVLWYEENYSDIKHGRKDKCYPAAKYLPGLFVSLGHGSRGFTTAFLAAEIISSLITHRPLPVSRKVAEYVHPSRIIVNDLKRR